MKLVEIIKSKAREKARRIVLPEGDEPRTVAAAKIARDERMAPEPVPEGCLLLAKTLGDAGDS